jgi:hypothetical protein
LHSINKKESCQALSSSKIFNTLCRTSFSKLKHSVYPLNLIFGTYLKDIKQYKKSLFFKISFFSTSIIISLFLLPPILSIIKEIIMIPCRLGFHYWTYKPYRTQCLICGVVKRCYVFGKWEYCKPGDRGYNKED